MSACAVTPSHSWCSCSACTSRELDRASGGSSSSVSSPKRSSRLLPETSPVEPPQSPPSDVLRLLLRGVESIRRRSSSLAASSYEAKKHILDVTQQRSEIKDLLREFTVASISFDSSVFSCSSCTSFIQTVPDRRLQLLLLRQASCVRCLMS